MKKITFLVLMLVASLGYAQNLTLPLDFESATQTYTFDDFNGGQGTLISNPQSSGINTSANVAQMVKSAGEVWGGTAMELANPIDFSANRTFKMKVYSPRVGARVLLKIENAGNGAIAYEIEDTVKTANSWEELTFDYNYVDQNNQYSKVVIIFDNGVMGDGSANFTFLYDDVDVVFGGPYLNRPDLPVTFEDATVDYTLTDFGGNYSIVTADPTGGSNMVAKTTKSIGAAGWAGTTMSRPFGFNTRIPITATETKMNVRVYSPRSGIKVRVKIEDAGDPTKSVETDTFTTVGNAWETLVFDFANEGTGTAALDPSYNFTMASIFFFYDTDGAGIGADSVYYWDNAKFGEPNSDGIEDLQALGLTYFPNPVQDQFFIKAVQKIDEVSVYTTLGQQVFHSNVNGTEQSFDFSFLSTGVYFVRVRMGEELGAFRLVKK